jgi:hypothetical protein
VLLGGYLWYHFSGIGNVAKDKTPVPKLNKALEYLHSIVKSYTTSIPGDSSSTDATFDSIKDLELHKWQRKEVDRIIWEAYEDVKKIVSEQKSMDLDSALAVLDALQKRTGELRAVVSKVSSGVTTPMPDKHLKLCESIGRSWSELKSRAERHVSEVKKVHDSTADKIAQTISSQGVSATSVSSIIQIVRENSDEAKKLAEKRAKDA